MQFDTWFAFFVACWVISVSPGAGAVACMSSGVNYGFKRGYFNVLGMEFAIVVQILIAITGLGALIAASETAFNVIKWLGVGYLFYLAFKQWRQPVQQVKLAKAEQIEHLKRGLFLKGFLVNMSNPKAIVFILAVFPQFMDTSVDLLPQYLLMMVTMIFVDFIVMGVYTGLATQVLQHLKSAKQQLMLNRIFASLFALAAIILCFVGQSETGK